MLPKITMSAGIQYPDRRYDLLDRHLGAADGSVTTFRLSRPVPGNKHHVFDPGSQLLQLTADAVWAAHLSGWPPDLNYHKGQLAQQVSRHHAS
jgi:hypothetical protein